MVLLKLGSKKSESKSVPEHLPALPHQEEPAPSVTAVPDSLPSLNKPESAKESPVEQPVQQAPNPEPASQQTNVSTQTPQAQEPVQKPQEQEAVKQPLQQAPKTEPASQQTNVPAQTPQSQSSAVTTHDKPSLTPSTPSVDNHSFFSRLQVLLDKDNDDDLKKKNKLKSLIEKDLFDTLNDFHDNEDSGTPFIIHHDELNQIIHSKIESLKVLENMWHTKKSELKLLQKEVDTSESKLKSELSELKKLMSDFVEDKLDENKHFNLSNGETISSIRELKEKLKSMSDAVFYHHVNDHRNDFANWVDHVFHNNELANKLREARSKDDLLRILNS
ncbi:MAG: hypothetical protein ACLFN8_00710 [Candidatus Woesearchaeota archaeon]